MELDKHLDLAQDVEILQKELEYSKIECAHLQSVIEQEKQRGSSYLGRYQLELVKRTSNPFSILILVIIAVCISSRKIKGGTGMHIAKGLALALIFVFFGRIADVIAVNTPIPAIVALWIPNLVFTVVAFYIYKTAPK